MSSSPRVGINMNMMRSSMLRCVVVASFGLPLAGCSLLHRDSKPTTEVATSNGSLPIRREASAIVELAQPSVEIDGNQVIVAGNVRVRGTAVNPDARIQISVVDKYGKVSDQIKAKLVATEDDRIVSYRVKFGPVPNRGSSLLVAYDDYHPFANYSADNIGSGGAGGAVSSGRSSGNSGVTNRKPSGVSTGTKNTKIK